VKTTSRQKTFNWQWDMLGSMARQRSQRADSTQADLLVFTDKKAFNAERAALQSEGSVAAVLYIVGCDPLAQAASSASDGLPSPSLPGGCSGGGEPHEPGDPDVTMSLYVYNEAVLQAWSGTGYTPLFMNEVVVDDVPPIEEAAFDIGYSITDTDGTIYSGRLRVRDSDGALAVVTATTTLGATVAAAGTLCDADPTCGAGDFWQCGHFCCGTQRVACYLFHFIPFIGPFLCSNCDSCVGSCCDCVNNPCHSCSGCGFTWFWNRFGICHG